MANVEAIVPRLGMRQEARLIHNEMFKGEWGDEVVFGILVSEWRARGNSAFTQRDD